MLDSTDLQGQPGALADRLRRDGYLLLRGALDTELVTAAADTGYAHLSMAGWLERGPAPRDAAPTVPVRARDVQEGLADPGFRRWAASPAFNRLPYQGALARLMAEILGPAAFPYPLKVPRVVYPAALVARHKGNQMHRDAHAFGAQDMVPAWVPLIDIPRQMGGLGVVPGSHRTRSPDPSGWRTADFAPGDVLIHHCLTAHASGTNTTGSLRLSAEYRWQYPDDLIPLRAVFGASPRREHELLGPLLRREPWWRPVPAGLRFLPETVPTGIGHLPASRFLAGGVGPAPREARAVG